MVKRSITYLRSYQAVWASHQTCLTLVVTLIWMTGFYSVYTFLGTFATTQFHLNTLQVGELFSLYGACNFVASFFSGHLMTHVGALKAVRVHGTLSALMIFGMVVGRHSLVIVAVSLGGLALVQGLGVPALTTYVVNLLPAQRSTVTAFNSSFLYLGLTLSSLVGGLGYAWIGFSGIALVAAGMLLLAVGLTVLVERVSGDEEDFFER